MNSKLKMIKIMKKLFFLNLFVFYLFFTTNVIAEKSKHFDRGKNLFEKNEFEKSKIFFERDIVFNPKSEKSYLYLAKIYYKNENDEEEEMHLNNVLLLNPQNEEAIYMLTLLKIKQSNYKEAKDLINKFDLVCNSFCSKKSEMQKKFNKLIPENAKDKN